MGLYFFFFWYCGSLIGWECKIEELLCVSVEDINIDGYSGFIVIGNEFSLGDLLCEVGI